MNKVLVFIFKPHLIIERGDYAVYFCLLALFTFTLYEDSNERVPNNVIVMIAGFMFNIPMYNYEYRQYVSNVGLTQDLQSDIHGHKVKTWECELDINKIVNNVSGYYNYKDKLVITDVVYR